MVRPSGDPQAGGRVSGMPEDRGAGFTSGAGFRGGNWNNATSNLSAADRNNAANTNANRNHKNAVVYDNPGEKPLLKND